VLKRLTWMAVGATAGAGASVWAGWRVKRAVRRYVPAGAGDGLGAVRSVAAEVAAAYSEGRDAMRQREEELRARLQPPPSPVALLAVPATGAATAARPAGRAARPPGRTGRGGAPPGRQGRRL
jgi:hypothetical protein